MPAALVAIPLITAPAHAAAPAPELWLTPLTVTGEKTERRLQDTATSASVLTGERLDELPANYTLDDAIGRLPNVVFTGAGNFAPTIRGDDATGPANGVYAFLGGTRPRVTIQQDGRPLSFNELVYGRSGLWDVERVEVLRGPQTTLQGRNSIAGALIVTTRDPTFEWEGGGRAVIANHDTRQFSGVVSGPLGDQVAFRLSADRRDHDSWVDLSAPGAIDDPTREKATNVRAKLLFLPKSLPDLSAKLTLNHTDTRRPQTEYVSAPFDQRVLLSGPGVFPLFENRADSAIVDLTYALGQGLELRNQTTWTRTEVDRLTAPGFGIARIRQDEVTNELIAAWQRPGLSGIVGLYLLDAQGDEEIDIGPGVFDDSTRTAAIFGEATITVLERLDLTLGARYEREERERLGDAGPFLVDLDETFEAFMPKVGIAYRHSDRITWGATVQRGWNAGGASIAFVAPFQSFTYDEEFVWNYEGFFRSSWLDERLIVNGNIFYADYEDQQRLALLDPNDPNSAIISNADAATSYGAELTATWFPVATLELFGGIGLLETEIERYTASAQDLTGNEFARAPGVTLSAGALYRHASGLRIGFDGQYVGDYFSDDDNAPSGKVDAYFLLNAQAAYEFDRYRVFAYVANITDEDSELLLFDDTAQLVDPREYGLGVEVSF